MFVIETTPESGPAGDYKIVVDHARNVKLQYVAIALDEPATAFLLTWGRRAIPFETRTDERTDQDGRIFYLTRIGAFGGSSTASVSRGIGSHRFANEKERENARMLAIEALLAYGAYYDGHTRPEGYNRIEHGGRTYTKKDFGMK